jgi:hypothetical protein
MNIALLKIKKFEKIKEKYSKLKNKLIIKCNELKEKYKPLARPFIILLIIYAIAFYPIARANFNFYDDLERISFGTRNWGVFSRFTSDNLSVLIYTSEQLNDISPLPQLIAVAILALSSAIILYLFKRDEKITVLNIISVIPLGLSPYFLECLSYKFDAPYMALSILASVVPFLFYGKGKLKKFIFCLINFFGALVMCTTYQAASGVNIMVTLFLAFKYWNIDKDFKEALKLLILSMLSFGIGLIIFQKFIMIPIDAYASSSIFPIKELIPGALSNLKNYYTYVKTDFRKLWIYLILAVMVCFVFAQAKYSKRNKILAFAFSIILIFVSSFAVFGLYPILQKPLFYPRAMYGYGVFIALIAVNATAGKKLYISKLVAFALCWCFFIFSFTYGNALSEQKRYVDFRVQSVINELNSLEMMNTDICKTINLNGNAGKSPTIDGLSENYRNLINRLLQNSFGGEWVWNWKYFENYFKLKNIVIDDNNANIPDNLETACDTMYYKIETNNLDYILITVK